ncbi:unnamed protein product [Ectocarpus sp. 4 AP-2014]
MTIGSGVIGCSTPKGTAKVGRGEHQTKTRARGDSARTNREPWMGPLDRGLLESARAEFRAAGDASGASEVDETLIKIKADFVMEAMEIARKSRDYDRLQELMFEAVHYFAVLARHGKINRHDSLGASDRRDAGKRTYERLRQPRRLCREYALEDGRNSREAAAALAKKRNYAKARLRLDDARRCFDWAGDAQEDLRKLTSVESEVEMRENATCGDRLTESVASKLQFLTPKDYSGLFSELSQAATAYEVAKDQDGTKVVRIVRAALELVLSAEQRWMQATGALKLRKYASASQLMKETKRFIYDATKGLPFVSPSLARAGKVLSPPGGLDPVDIVAELAALDGLKDHTRSIRALEQARPIQGMLDKAQQLNVSSREVFEFTARCCSTTSRCRSGDGGGESSSSVRCSSSPSSVAGGDTTAGAGAAASAGDDKKMDNDVAGFSLSVEELHEGEALLVKVRRSTSAPTNPHDGSAKPKSRMAVHLGVRHRVEDLLDDVSETEDIITRNKALERGDKLMAAFWASFGGSAAPSATDAASATALVRPGSEIGQRGVRSAAVDTRGATMAGVATVRMAAITRSRATSANKNTTDVASIGATSRGANGTERGEQQVPGPGGTLSPETASRCLRLLAEAKEAYDGQGFAQQADGAARLRAGLVADRCLAKAASLAPPAAATSTAFATTAMATAAATPQHSEAGTTPAIGVDGEQRLSPVMGDGGVGVEGGGGRERDFEAARAAVKEAEENYGTAGNEMGALVARRMEMSLRGDEAMVSIDPLLEKRAYVAVVEGLDQARRLYTAAGPQGLEGLARTRDPLGLVKQVAMRDGQRLKHEAVRMLRGGDVEASRTLCEQAQSCFSFVDREALADATADVYAAIHMVTRLASGDTAVAAAEAAFADGASDKAAQFLREAKSLYHRAQLSYEDLVDQVTTLLEERPGDLEAARNAMELQDNINAIYDSRRDGQRAVNVELRLDCLAADTSLENLAQVVDHEQFEDARTLLSAAAQVYERSADNTRLSKGGENGAKTAVLLRVRSAGDADRASALDLLERKDFEAAERAAFSARERLTWWADNHEDGGDSGGGGDSEAEGERRLERDQRQAIVRAAEELTTSVAAAVGQARAEGLMEKGRELKTMGDYVAAVKTLRSAAELFHDAGLAHEALVTRTEAARTHAEALLLTSVELHGEGNFEAVVEHLDRAEALLLDARKEVAGSTLVAAAGTTITSTATAQLSLVGLPSSSGDVDISRAVTVDSGKMCGGSDVGSHVLPGTEDDRDGAWAQYHILDDLVNLRSRVAGDIVMRGVAPALDTREYEEGLRLLQEAEAHYTTIKAGRWMTSVAAAVAVAAGKENSLSSPSSTPKELVTKRAAHDGDRLRAKAATAIQKEKNPVKARELLSGAEACMTWAGVDPFAAGAAAVSKDINVFESRAGGDEICKGLIGLLREKEFERAKGILEEALSKYRQQGDAFKQIADTRAIMFCVERESDFCADVISAISARDPAAALKMLEEARPVFQIAAELRSAVLQEAAELIGMKHQHITILSTLCRAWMNCVNGVVPASNDEADTLNPAGVLDRTMSDLRTLVASGVSVLDVPLDLFQESCDSVSAGIVKTRATPSPEASVAQVADPESSTLESEAVTALSTALGDARVGGGGDDVPDTVDETGTARDGSINRARCVSPTENAAGGTTDGSISGNTDRAALYGDAVVIDDDTIDTVQQGQASDSPGIGSREPKEGAGGERDWSSGETDENGDDVRVADNHIVQPTPSTEVTGPDVTDNVTVESVSGSVAKSMPPPPAPPSAVDRDHLPSDGVPDDPDKDTYSLPTLGGLGDNDALPLSSSTTDRAPKYADNNEDTSRGGGKGSQDVVAGFEANGGRGDDDDDGGNGSSEGVNGELPAYSTGTEQGGGNDADSRSLANNLADAVEDHAADRRNSAKSISTKASEGSASTNSANPDATSADSLRTNFPPRQSTPTPASGFENDDPIDVSRPSGSLQEAAQVEGAIAVDDEGSFATVGTTNQGGSSRDHLESHAVATAGVETLPGGDEDDVNYELDSDFSGDSDSPAVAGSRSSNQVSPPPTDHVVEANNMDEGGSDSQCIARATDDGIDSRPLSQASSAKVVAVEPDVVNPASDYESDYPDDIDKVDENDDGVQSDSSESSRRNSTGEEDRSHSSEGSSDRSSSGSSSRSTSSSHHLSDSYSAEDADSVHDGSTASSLTQTDVKATSSPPPHGEKSTNEGFDGEDGDDDYSLGNSSGDSASSSELEKRTDAAISKSAERVEQAEHCASSPTDNPPGTTNNDDSSLIKSNVIDSPADNGTEGAENENQRESVHGAMPEYGTGDALANGGGDGSVGKLPIDLFHDDGSGGGGGRGGGGGDGEPKGIATDEHSPSALPSTTGAVAANKMRFDDHHVNDDSVDQGQQYQQDAGEEPSDLYDIDDHGLSSSDDD